jgi:hypothetical protein
MLALLVVMVEGVEKRARNRGSPSERTRRLEKVAVLDFSLVLDPPARLMLLNVRSLVYKADDPIP